MAELSFRDFAGAIMQGDLPRAQGVLQELLGLAEAQAQGATEHFASRAKSPDFMMKAMGLRTAVTSGSDDDIGALLGDCFGLDGDVRTSAVATLRTRYPRP
jgi:hypothetical protein